MTADTHASNDFSPGTYRLSLLWIAIMFLLFPVLVIVGLIMRSGQGGMLPALKPGLFYALMTLHGLGMVGLWFAVAMAIVSCLLSRYARVNVVANQVAGGLTVLGVVMLVVATLVGRFAPGWYFLYPLPFKSMGQWPAWSTTLFLATLGVLGVAWLIWTLALLIAIARRYSLSRALAWHYIKGPAKPEVPVEPVIPPFVLITTVSLIALLVGLISAVLLLVLFLAEWLTGNPVDALLMKNLTFLFGHLLVNLTLYLSVGVMYEVLPEYAGRPWKTNRIVAIAWNIALGLLLLATFHHLYMDFVQPGFLHVLGQFGSYFVSVPAAAVSILGTLALVHGSPMRWNLASSLLFLGTMGWAIGGVGAVLDSTIALNTVLHNTLWVPAHFHTYYVMGCVLMLMGAAYHLVNQKANLPDATNLTRAVMAFLLIGGYGFLLNFYLAGAYSVPRRYAQYPEVVGQGTHYSAIAVPLGSLLLVGVLLYAWDTGRRLVRAYQS
ncbi:cbb3-type cytochrome c oxidase subunit I [bacterium CPR1]|nr:cbb3-type cytochrome c oxidase subunit I [bacterium CPR1]